MVSLKFYESSFWWSPLLNKINRNEGMKVKYLGNVITTWAKGEGCAEKALSTLWSNHVTRPKSALAMRVSLSPEGLRVLTKEHGVTHYWAHRITFCDIDKRYPRLCIFVYRHESDRLSQELRCHAVLCSSLAKAKQLASDIGQARKRAVSQLRTNRFIRLQARIRTTKPRQHKNVFAHCHNYGLDMTSLKVIDECPVAEEEEESEEVLVCEKGNHLDDSNIWKCTIWNEESKKMSDLSFNSTQKMSKAR